MRNAPGPEGLGAVDSQGLQADWGGGGGKGRGPLPISRTVLTLRKDFERPSFLV